jgi:hypothetical protein
VGFTRITRRDALMDYIVLNAVFCSVSLFLFVPAFLEYYVVRHDLSESQLAHILESLPRSLKPIIPYMSTGITPVDEIEMFVKMATRSHSLLTVWLSLSIPMLTLPAHIYLNLEKESMIVALILLVIWVGYLYLLSWFIQTARNALTA